MASTTKNLSTADILSTQTELYESIPITGSLIYGVYPEPDDPNFNEEDSNIKTYTHESFQTVYDYPHLSSSANQLFDITVGLSGQSSLYNAALASGDPTQITNARIKLNMYNQMSQILSGYDKSNQLQRFDKDGDLSPNSAEKHDDVFFMAFSRMLTKDSIKKGSFEFKVGLGAAVNDPWGVEDADVRVISDAGANADYFVNSPAGEYGILKHTYGEVEYNVGLIYYDAGIAVLSKDVFLPDPSSPESLLATFDENSTIDDVLQTSSINAFAKTLRMRTQNIRFNNIAELNSTVYHCRVHSGDFNYSTNPSYTENSKIRVKDRVGQNPVSYVTGVGLYSENGELLAIAKLSEPIKNDPTTDFTIKVRLDY